MPNLRYFFYSFLIFTLLGLSACSKPPVKPDLTNLFAQLKAVSEVPANKSPATGELSANLNTQTGVLNWTIHYSDLTGPITAAHFHGPATAGNNAGVAIPINGNLANPIKGVNTLSTNQVSELMDGKWYVNLHTSANPDGEIRGQITH